MSDHINAETDNLIPDYAVHDETSVRGFFGEFRFLSNFWPCEVGIWWNGIRFPSVENAYQAAKFPAKYQKEFVGVTATMAKKLAKEMIKEDPKILNKEGWATIKKYVMASLVFQKFNFDFVLQSKLLNTKDKFLEETNSWHDYYWGVCNGQGRNILGKILMQTRSFWNGISEFKDCR